MLYPHLILHPGARISPVSAEKLHRFFRWRECRPFPPSQWTHGKLSTPFRSFQQHSLLALSPGVGGCRPVGTFRATKTPPASSHVASVGSAAPATPLTQQKNSSASCRVASVGRCSWCRALPPSHSAKKSHHPLVVLLV